MLLLLKYLTNTNIIILCNLVNILKCLKKCLGSYKYYLVLQIYLKLCTTYVFQPKIHINKYYNIPSTSFFEHKNAIFSKQVFASNKSTSNL